MEFQSTFSQASDSSRVERKRASSGNDRLTLEEYFNFLCSRQTLPLTVNRLDQITRMHAFKKIQNVPKKVLADAVRTLDLLDLPRSTLAQRSVSGFAILNMDDVLADLEHLNWQECRLTSIKTCSSYKQSVPSASTVNKIIQTTPCHPFQLQPYSQKKLSQPVALKTCSPNKICGRPQTSKLLQNPDSRIRKRAKKTKPRLEGGASDCSSSLDGVSLGSCGIE